MCRTIVCADRQAAFHFTACCSSTLQEAHGRMPRPHLVQWEPASLMPGLVHHLLHTHRRKALASQFSRRLLRRLLQALRLLGVLEALQALMAFQKLHFLEAKNLRPSLLPSNPEWRNRQVQDKHFEVWVALHPTPWAMRLQEQDATISRALWHPKFIPAS